MKDKNYFSLLITLIICTIPLPLILCTIIYGILVLYTCYFAFTNKIKPKFNFSQIAFILFFAVMLMSYTWSINKNLTLIGIGRKSAFIVLPILFAFIPKFSHDTIKYIFKRFSYAMGLYAVFFIGKAVINFLFTGNLSYLSQDEIVSLDLNRIYMSLFTVVAIFYIIYNEKNKLNNRLLLVLLFTFLLLLSSKTIILTTLMVFIILGLKSKIQILRIRNLLFIMVALFIGLILFKYNPKFYSELIPTKFKEVITKNDFEKNYYFNGSELRILYSRFLFELENEQDVFLTGFGLNATQEKIEEKCIQYRVPEGYGTKFNFHNQYNQTLAELGIFGLLLLLSILYFGFKHAIINKNTFAIAVFMVFSTLLFTESVFNRQRGIYFFLFMYFVIVNTNCKKHEIK